MPALHPCLFDRKILPKPWGGRALSTVLGIELPPDIAVGETWEVYDRPDGSSRVRGSEVTLRSLMQRDQAALLGRARPGHGGYFPLLLKYLDAREALSLQVHPDDEAARSERESGKCEAWVVLGAGPQARIIRGIKPGVSKPQLAEVVKTGADADANAIAELLLSFQPGVGDCIYVPAGTVHAIGPDVVVFEVQQNSDVTYRLYDWGRQREVHVDKALAVAHLDAGSGERPVVAPRGDVLVSTPHFRLRRLQVTEQRAVLATEGAFVVINVIAGRGMLGWHSGGNDAPLLLQTGDCALVPACIDQVFLSPIGRLQVLLTDPGEVR